MNLKKSLKNDLSFANTSIKKTYKTYALNSEASYLYNALYVANQAQELLDTLSELTDKGISPSNAASILFDGIKEDKFYIFTDEKTKTSFQERVGKMIA